MFEKHFSVGPAGVGDAAKEETPLPLDELDYRIIEELMSNSRESFRNLAAKLHASPATIIQRVRRLQKEKVLLGFSSDLNFPRMGFEYMALVEATITKGALLEVQKKIAFMPGVVAVYDVTGESDSIVVARCRTRRELSRLVKKILAIPNVERTNSHVVLNVIKEGYRLMPEVP